jgi:hypothetical protein
MTNDPKTAKELIELNKQLNLLVDSQINKSKGLLNNDEARALQAEKIANNQKLINELKSKILELDEDERKLLDELINEQREIQKTEKETVKTLKAQEESRRRINNIIGEANRQLKAGWQYLMQSDKVIKSTILGLGMSGIKADLMRQSFEQSAGLVARLGGSLEDIGNIMTGYADETGRARALSADMVKDITAIGKGTGLGIEGATKLGAQFELMGFDAKSTMDYVQGVVDTSERMGVNTTKVLKSVNDNFKRLNTYTFQQGVKGMAQMAEYAEKFKVDISSALDAADISRTLEGAIELTAKLQIMGGEFAKTDPFQMLFLARNDPAKFAEKIGDMTKGIVTFRKMADGTFEKFISPADRDRLASVAKSLGISVDQMTQMAERQADIQKMRQQMAGMGLDKREKELIEGAAIMNKATGRFEVQIGTHMKDISTLTKDQADAFAKQQVSLQERAKQAQTFDEAFKATIMELKASLLPILKAVNGVLTAVRPYVIQFTEWISKGPVGWLKVGGMFMAAGVLWKGILQPLAGKIGKATVGKLASKIGGTAVAETGEIAGKGGGFLGKTGGKAMAGAGAGIGAAALGVGAGIGAAAAGISLLANAMSKLDDKKIEALKSIVKTLGWFVGGGAAIAAVIMAFGAASTAAAPGLLAFGGAITLIGAGIGIAAAGIGVMGMGLAKLVEASKGAGEDMPKVALGIAGIAASMGAATLALPGAIGMTLAVASIGRHAPAIATVGESLEKIKLSLSGSKEDFVAVKEAIESIGKVNIKGGGAIADLANMLRKPLQVEFAQGRVNLVNDITLNLDGQKFMKKAYDAKIAIQKHEEVRTGKA